MYNRKNIVIIIMIIVIMFMAVGYAILSTNLTITGTSNVTSTWRVEFSSITTASQKGGATNKITPSVTATTATFEVDLVQPGDEIVYNIGITNYGDIDAEIKSATYTVSGSEAIYIRIDGVRKGTLIESCEGLSTCPTKTLTLTVGYDPAVTSDPSEKTKSVEVTINTGQYTQSNPTPDGELIPALTANKTLVQQILSDNTAQSDIGIDFGQISSDTNGKGLYFTSKNTENNQVTYYFRGAVTNNYVSFAGITWRIVRINEDGSIRLITQDNVGNSAFNTHYNDNAYVGYMYGATGQTGDNAYALTHTNNNPSTIKTVLDTWYVNNLSSYVSYLADAGFCNDRSIAPRGGLWYSSDTALGYGQNTTYYGAYNRVRNSNQPQFACPQTNDLFTTSSSPKGNKALTYPIGLITADEVAYAGGVYDKSNTSMYLSTGDLYWTMSPRYFVDSYAREWLVDSDGLVGSLDVRFDNGVRPVINIKGDVIVSGGNGTSTNPYVIRIN